jgi:hypothetical protein
MGGPIVSPLIPLTPPKLRVVGIAYNPSLPLTDTTVIPGIKSEITDPELPDFMVSPCPNKELF